MNLNELKVADFIKLLNCLDNKNESKGQENNCSQDCNEKNDVRIVILQRGWVVVGHYSRAGNRCYLNNAKVIRNWGTSKGLGEIAENGPTEKTILDSSPTVEFHELTEIANIKCNTSKWKVLVK